MDSRASIYFRANGIEFIETFISHQLRYCSWLARLILFTCVILSTKQPRVFTLCKQHTTIWKLYPSYNLHRSTYITALSCQSDQRITSRKKTISVSDWQGPQSLRPTSGSPVMQSTARRSPVSIDQQKPVGRNKNEHSRTIHHRSGEKQITKHFIQSWWLGGRASAS